MDLDPNRILLYQYQVLSCVSYIPVYPAIYPVSSCANPVLSTTTASIHLRFTVPTYQASMKRNLSDKNVSALFRRTPLRRTFFFEN